MHADCMLLVEHVINVLAISCRLLHHFSYAGIDGPVSILSPIT